MYLSRDCLICSVLVPIILLIAWITSVLLLLLLLLLLLNRLAVCPAGRGPVPLCLFKCEPGTFSNGTMAECTE
jgi:hypothetical protein